jgi:hypothetical protein
MGSINLNKFFVSFPRGEKLRDFYILVLVEVTPKQNRLD